MPDAAYESIVNDKNEQLQFYFCRNQFIIMQSASDTPCSDSSLQANWVFSKYFSFKSKPFQSFLDQPYGMAQYQ